MFVVMFLSFFSISRLLSVHSTGKPEWILPDVEAARPTVFCSVPRLYNKLYSGILSTIESSSWLTQWLWRTAFDAKLTNLKDPSDGAVTHALWDALVFKKVRAKLGGRVRTMITGSAPIAAHVLDFFRVVFSVSFIEGYGQTESTAGSSTTIPGYDSTGGHVGCPTPANEVKLVDVDGMGYTSRDMIDGRIVQREVRYVFAAAMSCVDITMHPS